MNKKQIESSALIEKLKNELSRGFLKSELESVIGLSKNSLSAIVNLKKSISFKDTLRIQKYFDKPVDERPDPLIKGLIKKTESSIPTGRGIDKVVNKLNKKVSESSQIPDIDFSFKGVTVFRIEELTKYPLKDKPLKGWEKEKWLKEKAIADQKIRDAWVKYKTSKGL